MESANALSVMVVMIVHLMSAIQSVSMDNAWVVDVSVQLDIQVNFVKQIFATHLVSTELVKPALVFVKMALLA
jgi:hypothetical protein